MTDRHGNPNFTDGQQIIALADVLAADGFGGSKADAMLQAEAWWFCNDFRHRVPNLDLAQDWKRERRERESRDNERVERSISAALRRSAKLSERSRANAEAVAEAFVARAAP